ncbi:MAG: molybdopterin molybdotransferase MoeA, partial [Pseudomonadota bacterium]
MISVDEAQAIIVDALANAPAEPCELPAAHGRVLAEPLCADRDQPPFDRVMMDGVALRFSAFAGGRRRFTVQETQGAGQPASVLASDAHCVEIMTGAALPEGCDCIVPVEQLAVRDGVVELVNDDGVASGRFVHRQASDYCRGDVLLPSGTRLRAPELAIAASVGAARLSVARRPRIAVVASGDELVDVGDPVAPFQLRRSNDYALAGALAGRGFDTPPRFHVRDDPSAIEALIDDLLSRFDVLVLSGGVSMGKYDYLPGVLENLSVDVRFHRVAQR